MWGIPSPVFYIGTSGGTRFALVVWLCGVTTRTSLADEDGSLFWLWCLGYVDRMNWMANTNIGMAARTQWNCGKMDTGISLDSCMADGGNWNLSMDDEDGMDGRYRRVWLRSYFGDAQKWVSQLFCAQFEILFAFPMFNPLCVYLNLTTLRWVPLGS